MAGVSTEPGDDLERSMVVLSSSALAELFIKKYDLLPLLFKNRWNEENKSWKEDKGGKPSYWLAATRFDKKIRFVSRDTRTGIITVAFESRDRQQAARWANDYVALANEQMRLKAIAESRAALASLKTQLQASELLEVRNIIYGLLESQVSKLTLAEARPEFAFTVLDPAVAPDEDAFVRPQRFAIVFLWAMAGTMLGMIIMIFREIFPRTKN
jgi:LPS O-antigen subunit length determinant protein (WzzB/FepE family)